VTPQEPPPRATPAGSDLRRAALARRHRRPLLLIVNSTATGVSPERTELAIAVLGLGYRVEVAETGAPGEAVDLARMGGREGYALVVAFGGDGTVNEVANGLAGGPTPLGCLPGGRTNVFARTLGLPAEPVEAAARLLVAASDLRPRRVDLGLMNDRFFTFASGIGLSASLNRRVDRRPGLKSRLGSPYLAYAALSTMNRRYIVEPPHVRVSVGSEEADGVTVVAQNSDPLTYLGPRPIRVCDAAGLETGTISLALLRRSTRRDVSAVVARIASGNPARVLGHRRVRGFPDVRRADVRSVDGRPLPVEVDGEYVGELDAVRYDTAPRKLAVAA
jgi:diacylglycerol kinase family enzyme